MAIATLLPRRRGAESSGSPDGSAALDRTMRFVVDRPLLAVALVGGLGAALGGFLFSRAGRLAFAAVAGYVANELWHREGRLDIDDVVERLVR